MANFIIPAVIAYGLKKTSDALKAPSVPNLPQTPTIDTAAQQQQDTDRLRRRRGVLDNIFAGQTNQQPTTGTKTLLGE